MQRERNIFPIALACSLGLHLVATEGYLGYSYVRALRAARPVAARAEELVVRLDDIGDPSGAGIASNGSPGDKPMQAREAEEDQALLSRDPVGMGRIGDPPSKWTGPTGSGAGGPLAAAQALVPPAPAIQPAELPAPSPPREVMGGAPAVVVRALPEPDVKVAAVAVDPKPPVAMASAAPTQVATAAQPEQVTPRPQARGDGQRPGLPLRSADPLPENDSDSDPFLRITSTAIYHDGKLDVRDGRVVKAVRPQLGIAGLVDVFKLNFPKVVCRIEIAPTGKVISVKVAQSSRSIAIDEPVQTAMYDWTFQPARDRHGKPIADTIYFTIEFR